MTALRVFQVDSFTRRPFTGNPAGVVIGGEHIDDRQMQALARELNNSETAFILPADAEDHDLQIRFFTPTVEVPSCGHATLAAHYVRASLMNAAPSRVRHKIGVGLLAADLDLREGDYFVTITQAPPTISEPYLGAIRAEVVAALGLGEDDLAEDLPIVRIDTGNPKVMNLGSRSSDSC